MITLAYIGYILISICFFVGLVRYTKHNRLLSHVDKEDLFFIIFASAIWPIVTVGIIVYKLFELLEWMVNK